MDFALVGLLALGIVAGFVIGYLIARIAAQKNNNEEELNELKVELKLEQERAVSQAKDIQTLNEQLASERSKVLELSSEKTRLQSEYRNLNEKLENQKSELVDLQDKFSAQFKNLANEIFEEKSKRFTDQNKLNLDALLKPLGEKLVDFERKVEQTNKESLIRSTELKEQLTGLKELNQRMSKEAENLTKALKGDTKIQGDWGELVLERILEQSGLQKDREYFLQTSMQTDDGRRRRPDVIIKLPDSKNLVIDAKASLVAYERYVNADDEKEREQHLKEHLLSVKNHIRALADKSYHQLFESGSLDYTLMFVPIEAAFALIIEKGSDLYTEAHNRNIVIVSPATLIATLRTVANIWKHEYQNQNALEIARQGGALYDKFKSFVDDLIKVGQSMESTQKVYKMAMNKLVEGKDNLISKTERLRKLGAKTSKVIDQKIVDRAEPEMPVDDPIVQQNLFGS